MNLVERFFSEITQRQLKCLAVFSVPDLDDAIRRYINTRNQTPNL